MPRKQRYCVVVHPPSGPPTVYGAFDLYEDAEEWARQQRVVYVVSLWEPFRRAPAAAVHGAESTGARRTGELRLSRHAPDDGGDRTHNAAGKATAGVELEAEILGGDQVAREALRGPHRRMRSGRAALSTLVALSALLMSVALGGLLMEAKYAAAGDPTGPALGPVDLVVGVRDGLGERPTVTTAWPVVPRVGELVVVRAQGWTDAPVQVVASVFYIETDPQPGYLLAELELVPSD